MIYLYSFAYILILIVMGAVGGFHIGYYVFLERHRLRKYFSYQQWMILIIIIFILAAVLGELKLGGKAALGSGYIALMLSIFSFVLFYKLSIKQGKKLKIKLKTS
jgi:drug/metabolite transporter (DMT)-like permease